MHVRQIVYVMQLMVVFNLFALAEVLVAVAIYALIGLVAPDLGEYADLVGIAIWFLVTAVSEFFGFCGRLFWLPANLFAGFGISMELMPHLGNAAFAVGMIPSVLLVGWCFWRRSQEEGDEEASEEPLAAYGQQPHGQQPHTYGQQPHAYGQQPHGQPPHGQPPHGQPPHAYGQQPHDAAYGQPPHAQQPHAAYGQPPHAQQPHAAYGQQPPVQPYAPQEQAVAQQPAAHGEQQLAQPIAQAPATSAYSPR